MGVESIVGAIAGVESTVVADELVPEMFTSTLWLIHMESLPPQRVSTSAIDSGVKERSTESRDSSASSRAP